jgi:hypothetical protein
MDGSVAVPLPGPVAPAAASFDRQLLDRLPLAEAAFLGLAHCWDDAFLDGLFEAHAAPAGCYTDKIDFPTLVRLVCDALVRDKGSGNKAFTRARKDGRLKAAVVSVYQKLGRTPIPLSVAFLRECTARLRQVFPALPDGVRAATPPCLDGLGLRVVDGKTLKHLARRLKVLRGVRGRMLGGKLLVCVDPRSGLALAMAADPDAFRNDVALADGLLAQLPPDPSQPCLFVADRQFCDLGLLAALCLRRDHFLVRYSKNVGFTPDPSHPATEGTDARGRRWAQCRGTLGAQTNKNRRQVRMITLYRPGDEDVAVVTDLLDEAAYPAGQLLDAYLARWGIEAVFQQVTEVFGLDTLIGSTPAATIFQAAFCFVAYNVTQMIKAYVAEGAGRAVEGVSTAKLFDDVAEQMRAAAAVAGPAAIARAVAPVPPPAAVAARLRDLLSGAWRDWWVKCPTTVRPPAEPTRYAKSGRASVHRLLRDGVEPHTRPHRKRPAARRTKPAAKRKTTKRHT